MSMNFELLQRISKGEHFGLPEKPVQLPQKGRAAFVARKKGPPDLEITKLVQRLYSSAGNGRGPKVVSFSGIAGGDRSAWICLRAAEALAGRADGTVCLVEANLWSPQLHIQAGTANQFGLADALITKGPVQGFAIPFGEGNLSLISSGFVKPGFHTSMDRYRERFAELREAYDHVLISAPPLTQETEATFLGQLADGIVLVVEANHSRRETVRRVKEQLEIAQVKLLGAVLDQRTFPIPEKLYRRL